MMLVIYFKWVGREVYACTWINNQTNNYIMHLPIYSNIACLSIYPPILREKKNPSNCHKILTMLTQIKGIWVFTEIKCFIVLLFQLFCRFEIFQNKKLGKNIHFKLHTK